MARKFASLASCSNPTNTIWPLFMLIARSAIVIAAATLAFAWSTANCTPRISAVPISAPGSVSGKIPPNLMASATSGAQMMTRPAASGPCRCKLDAL
jgi:hypothetical protein